MKNLHVQITMSILLMASLGLAQETFNPATGHFYRLSPSPMTLAQARDYAATSGGHLVTIDDAAENAWVRSTFGSGDRLIGLTDIEAEGLFVWDSGEQVGYTNWCPGEPDDNAPGGEDAVIMIGSASGPGCWSDVSATTTNLAVIEYETSPPLFRWNFNPATGTSYHLTSPMSLADARAAAQAFGGYLASITSQAEQEFIDGIYSGRTYAIGLTDSTQEGVFVWDSLEPTGYVNFCPGEPDDADNGDLVLVTPSGCWADTSPNGQYQFLVETSNATAIHNLSSFEFAPAGANLTAVPNAEGWTDTPASFTEISTLSGSGVPHGSKWLRICGATQAAFPPVTSSTAPFLSFSANSVSRATLDFETQAEFLAFDWEFHRAEDFASNFNDFARVTLVSRSSGLIVAMVLYVDTFSPIAASSPSPRIHTRFRMPSSLLGQPLRLMVEAGNQSDGAISSSFFIDNIRLIVELPGNSTEVELAGATGLDGSYLSSEVDVTASDLLSIRLTSTNATYRASPPLLVASIGPSGSIPPAIPGFPDIHIDAASAIIVFDPFSNPFGLGLLPVGGLTLGYVIPQGLGGNTVRFQYLALSSAGPNGIYASSSALNVIVAP